MIEKFVEFITGFGILTSAIAAVIFAAAAVLLIVCPLAIFRIVRYILIGVCVAGTVCSMVLLIMALYRRHAESDEDKKEKN